MSTTLDLAEFEKLRALMDAAPTPSEQARPRLKARMMARAAGLTLEQAIAEADRAKEEAQRLEPAQTEAAGLQNSVQAPLGPLHALTSALSTPEALAFGDEREKARQARRRELLQEYGSEEALFAETAREAALRIACEPLISPGSRPGLPSLLGWGPAGSRVDAPAAVLEAVARAWPLPPTVRDAWAELSEAEKITVDRHAVHQVEYHPPGWIEARRYVIEDLLDTLPATGPADLLARLSWMEHLNEIGFSRDRRTLGCSPPCEMTSSA